jgi:phosphate/sulfate permease
VLRRMIAAWVTTFPACAIIAYLAATVANALWA